VRSLYFHAHVGAFQPGAILGMMSKVEKTMLPFDRFLGQAIAIAEKRQTLYALPWERAYDAQPVKIRPLDGRVVVPRRLAGWLIADWPPEVEPDPGSPVMVPLRNLSLAVLDYRLDPAGLHLILDGELDVDDMAFWCGQQCRMTREAIPPPPVEVANSRGEPLRMARPPEYDEEGWILVLEDWIGPGTLIVDGAEVHAAKLPDGQALRTVTDTAGTVFEMQGTQLLGDEQPASGPLTGDNGVRFRWSVAGGREGMWVQLLLPPGGGTGYDFLDPRAALCDGDVKEVWTQPRRQKDAIIGILGRDPDRYQIRVTQWPPADSLLYLPTDVGSLQLQKRAAHQLINTPLPHHRGLLRLCLDPANTFWPAVTPKEPQRWTALTDLARSGTDEQRDFVARALGSPDLMMLEGPPGSGKTTVICELVRQLIAEGKRVLLCASTHVAIDNALERLIDADPSIYAVRIGQVDRVDEKVKEVQLGERVQTLVDTWRQTPHLQALGEEELKAMATRVVVRAADLTCGTTMGIMSHPLLAEARRRRREPLTRMPHWDVLIVDEASKTLIQEFLVPALMAKRWVIVGDVQQLPPFNERADIEANLRSLADGKGREVFPADHQRACLIRYWLARNGRLRTGARWLIVEPPGVLDWLGAELLAREELAYAAVRVVTRAGTRPGPFLEITVDQIRDGDPMALALAACDLVLVADDLLPAVAGQLPASLLHHADLTNGEHAIPASHPLLFQHLWWLGRSGKLRKPYSERRDTITTFAESERYEQRWLAAHDLASEIAWRLTRLHELKHSANQNQRESLRRALDDLLPAAADIKDYIDQIREIGFPSILEVLQEGIGTGQADRRSALTEGLGRQTSSSFQHRFGSLSYQHRMHPDISAFPRDLVYQGKSLLDANTIEVRDRAINWTFGPFPPGRRAWMDVDGYDHRGENAAEIKAMENVIRRFLGWAAEAGPPGREPAVWEVACLAFYLKQASAMSRMLATVTGDKSRRTRFRSGNVEIVCGTVDRFQGREADLVFLSMCNTRRVGFLDSRNRLNVAITRARQQLLVFGKAQYFRSCGVPLLQELVRRSQEQALWRPPPSARPARPPARVRRPD
jgi:hypothetical protein